ncbi:MAG: hypothetical protein ACRENN_08250, partial [Candidatus Eiseniibacteriota bacterium]
MNLLRLSLLTVAVVSLGMVVSADAASKGGAKPRTVLDFSAVTIDGTKEALSTYKGKALLQA